MVDTDHCEKRFALLNQAERLLDEVRVYTFALPVRDALARHRLMLDQARRHIESAQALRAA